MADLPTIEEFHALLLAMIDARWDAAERSDEARREIMALGDACLAFEQVMWPCDAYDGGPDRSLYALAERALGSREAGEEWMRSPLPLLGSRPPAVAVVEDADGEEKVRQILNGIEFGLCA